MTIDDPFQTLFLKGSAFFLCLMAGFLFFAGTVNAATLYFVGDNFGTAADWNTTNPGACNNDGGDGTVPVAGDTIVLDADCDNTLFYSLDLVDDGLTVVSEAGYSGTFGAVDTGADEEVTFTDVTFNGGTWDMDGYDHFVTGDMTIGASATLTTGSNTVTFNGSGDQDVDTGGSDANHDFNNVTINNSGSTGSNNVQLDGNKLMVNGNVNITDGALTANNEDIEVTGTFEVGDDGVVSFEGTETFTLTPDTDSGTVWVNNTTSNSPYGNTFYNLLIIPGSTFTLPATIDVNGNLTISSGAGITTSGNDMTVGANWTNGGTFTHGSAAVTFDGAIAQSISGDTTFYDLTISGGTERTVAINSGDTLTIDNSLSMNGASGAILAVEGGTSGSLATIALGSSTESTSFLSLKDIEITGAAVLCDPACINRGNNPGWIIIDESGNSAVAAAVTVESPNGTETYSAGDTVTVEWSYVGDYVEEVLLEWSEDGVTYETIESWTVDPEDPMTKVTSHDWTVPEVETSSAKMRVTLTEGDDPDIDDDGNTVMDASNAAFGIGTDADVQDDAEGDTTTDEADSSEGSEQNSDGPALVGLDVTDADGAEVLLSVGGLFRGANNAAVYRLNGDGTRSVFPSESVFFSHGYSFDDVLMIADTDVSLMPLGSRLVMAEGSLVKLRTSPEVYAVGADGGLEYLLNEQVARDRFGDDWSGLVWDVNDVFWNDYAL